MHDIRFRFDEAAAFYGNPENEAPLRGAVPGSAIALDSERCAWRADDGTRVEALSTLEARVLEACDVFQRPSPQADDVADRTGLPHDEAVRTLESLAARGLLATPAALLGTAVPRDRTPLPAPLVAIRADGDAGKLSALLDSLLADERRLGATRRYVVCDECDAPAVRDASRRFANASTSSVWHVGSAERAALAAAWLDGCDAAGRVALDALLQVPRNLAVLLSAGGTLALLDSAHRLPLREPVGAHSRLELWDSPEVETRFLDDASAFEDRPRVDGDAFAIAARWVGQPVRAVVPRDDERFMELENAPVIEVARATARARVVCVAVGTYGAMPTRAWEHATSRKTLADLWRAPFDTARLAGASTWNGVLAPRLMYACAGVPLLLDNRELLPFGDDDIEFARTLQALEPAAACVWLPLLLGYFPSDPRNAPATDARHLAALIGRFGTTLAGDDRAQRLAALGALCAEHAAADDDVLVANADGADAPRRAEHARRLALALARPGVPEPWRAQATAMLQGLRESLRNPPPAGAASSIRAQLRRVADAAGPWAAAWIESSARAPLDSLEPLRA